MFARCFATVCDVTVACRNVFPQAFWPLGASSVLVRQQHLPACENSCRSRAKSSKQHNSGQKDAEDHKCTNKDSLFDSDGLCLRI
jgi:hypothetical protein